MKTPEYLSDSMDGTNAGALPFFVSTRRDIVVHDIAMTQNKYKTAVPR